jgi:hypothetical protein
MGSDRNAGVAAVRRFYRLAFVAFGMHQLGKCGLGKCARDLTQGQAHGF